MQKMALFALLCAPLAAAEHVVVIGIDGLSPDGIRRAETPVFDRLMREGSYTLKARGVFPTVSSPNWASMIMGAGPEQHGITSNEWTPDKVEIPPVARGPAGFFPTMFSQVRSARPGAKIAVFHDWQGFGRLVEPSAADVILHCDGPEKTIRAAIEYFAANRPLLMFIHLDHVDHAGHEKGHGSPEYYAAVSAADRLVGQVLKVVEDAGLAGTTAIIVAADHGGAGKKHGGMTLSELEIPFIAWGAGVPRGQEIQRPVNVYDVAASVVHCLNVPPHAAWIAKPAF